MVVMLMGFLLELIWIGPDRGKLVAASARMMTPFSHIGGVLSSRLVMMSMVMGRMLIGYSRRPTAGMIRTTTRVVRMRSMDVDGLEIRIGIMALGRWMLLLPICMRMTIVHCHRRISWCYLQTSRIVTSLSILRRCGGVMRERRCTAAASAGVVVHVSTPALELEPLERPNFRRFHLLHHVIITIVVAAVAVMTPYRRGTSLVVRSAWLV